MDQHAPVEMHQTAGRTTYPREYNGHRTKPSVRITNHTCPVCGAITVSPSNFSLTFYCNGVTRSQVRAVEL